MIKSLIIDDDPLIQNILSAMLQEQSVAVLNASTGKQAIELLEISIPDCIFMDVFLSDISGIELARKIKQICAGKLEPKIIFVSANSLSEVKELDQTLEIDYFLRKPFKSQAVKEIISQVFE